MPWNVTTWANAPSNPDGAPAAWPYDAQPVPAGTAAPDAPAVQMSDDDYAAYLTEHRAEYMTWWTALAKKITVPRVVDAFKAKITLSETASPKNAGKTCLDDCNALVATLPQAQQIAWSDAHQFDRASPLLNALAGQIGLTDTEVDAMFIAADKLVV